MGEVYRARDSKLGRSVAIKVISEGFGADADRVARFEREAKVLASINHPNIAALYGMEEWDGQHFLIMELVEGETLAERLLRGPLAVEEALRIVLQTAEALEAAHERGIVHRDLKPANIKITPDDKVKVLDFGLAKTIETEPARDVANSPTLSMMATNAGIILGTAAYMSPEQAKAFPADHRSDVFSFGVVFYETLTGRQPFQGETAPDILASVLVREPELQRLPSDLNPRIAELLRRCLEKNPKRRWQAMGDLRAELEAIASSPRPVIASVVPVAPPRPLWRRVLPVATASVVAALLGAAAVWQLKPSPPREITRFTITLPDDQVLTGVGSRVFDISPDGRHVAFTAAGTIYVRPMSDLIATPIQITQSEQNSYNPTFSPDGREVAFFTTDGSLKRTSIDGGAAVTVCRNTRTGLMTWAGSDIFFSSADGLMRVPAAGGTPERIDVAPDERVQRVQMLPDGETLLLTILPTGDSLDRWANGHVVAQSLRSKSRKLLVKGATDGWYVATGHLLYMSGGTLHAVGFDPSRLETSGAVVPIVEGVRRANLRLSGVGWFGVSNTGTLLYVPGPTNPISAQVDVGIVEQNGIVTALKLPLAPYRHPRVSPNGEQIALETDDGKEAVVRVYDVVRQTPPQRITFAGNNRYPIWTADSRRVAFQSDRQGDSGIFWQTADGSSDAVRLTTAASDERHIPESWHPGGDVLLYSVAKGSDFTLWTYSLGDKRATPFGGVRSERPTDGVFSPDGKWVAYSSGGSSGGTVYVQPFPATGAKYEFPNSRDVATPHHPLWSSANTLVVNQRPGTLDVVAVTTSPTFSFGTPVRGARRFQTGPPSVRRAFDVMPDGRLVGLIEQGDTDNPLALRQFTIVLNWFEELKARVPTR
jgi:serine/threonine-protein kinase